MRKTAQQKGEIAKTRSQAEERKIRKMGLVLEESLAWLEKSVSLKMKHRGEKTYWEIDGTPLSEQAKPLSLDLEAHLEEKARKARAEGRKLRLLVFGMGSGSPDLAAFLERYADCVEFHGTTLPQDISILPPYYMQKHKIHFCDVSGATEALGRMGFDIILSHFSTHGQNLLAIDVFYRLLKPGGEAVVVVPRFSIKGGWKTISELCEPFELLEHAQDEQVREGKLAEAFHLRKPL
ncbi:MAG: hypothetical protein N3E51_03110 [Candidatus Micrarchaeota archaeon]|nr:hypothetical protein [Candidatus Micrarchaeota archaeon]